MNKEIAIIQRELKIPVTDAVFFPEYVEIVSGKDNIGSIPYYTVGGINTYDTNISVVNWLKWNKVYDQHKNELNQKIADLVDNADVVVVLSTFRRLYAKDADDKLICAITCFFDENGWSVERE